MKAPMTDAMITDSIAILLDAIANRTERASLKKALRAAASQMRKYGFGKVPPNGESR